METTQRYLVHFFKKFKYLDFCLNELEALARMFGTDLATLYHHSNPRPTLDMNRSTMVYVNLPNDHVAQKIQERSVLIKEILNVFAESSNRSYEDLLANVDEARLREAIHPSNKFKFIIEGVGCKVSTQKQIEVINMFKKFPFDQALVDLDNYSEYYKVLENDADGRLYFGKMIAALRLNERQGETFYGKFSLKKRPYLGPTSTDAELAFLMANQGLVQEGDFVYDPFVGTGSIATALQYFKAFVFGSDLDIRVIKGYGVGRKTKNEVEGLEKIEKFDVTTNFRHYNIPIPEFFV